MKILTTLLASHAAIQTRLDTLTNGSAVCSPGASIPPPPPPFPPLIIETPILPADNRRFTLPPGTPLPPLETFTGEDTSMTSAWLGTVEAWLMLSDLSTSLWVQHIGTFYLKGRAKLWWQGCRDAATYANNPLASSGGFSSFASFRTALITALGNPFPQAKARRDLDVVRQTASVSAYASNFQSIVSLLPPTESANHLYAFMRGLKPEIQLQLTSMINMDTDTWHRAYTLASTIESSPLYRPNAAPAPAPRRPTPTRLSAASDVPSSPRRGRSPTPHPSTNANPPPKLDPITDEERARLIRLGGCFRCRQLGHISTACPIFTNPRTPGPSRGASPSRPAPKN